MNLEKSLPTGLRPLEPKALRKVEVGSPVMACSRVFAIATAEIDGHPVRLAVHVESAPGEIEAILAMYFRRANSLRKFCEQTSSRTWLGHVLGLAEDEVLARLTGTTFVSHAEAALVEQALNLEEGSIESMGPQDIPKTALDELCSCLSKKVDLQEWALTPLYQRISQNLKAVISHPAMALYVQDTFNPQVDLALLDESSPAEWPIATQLVEALGYPVEWPVTHPSDIPTDLGERLRKAFPRYFALVDDWITARPGTTLKGCNTGLGSRPVAALAGVHQELDVPSFEQVSLPYPVERAASIEDGATSGVRHANLQTLLQKFGDNRTRFFAMMEKDWPSSVIASACSRKQSPTALFCRHVEVALGLPAGWLDRPIDADYEFEPLVEQANRLVAGHLPSLRVSFPLYAVRHSSSDSQPAHPRAPKGAANKRQAPKPELAQSPVAGPSADPALFTIRRDNLAMLTGHHGSKQKLAALAGLTSAALSHRIGGQKPLWDDDANLFAKALRLPLGWMDVPRTWDELPVSVQRTLSPGHKSSKKGG